MPLSDSILAYEDVRALLDKALAAPRGIRVTRETAGKAKNLLHRCNKFRALDRIANAKLYPDGEPWHGVSPYDELSITIDGCAVTMAKRAMLKQEIEVL